MNPNNTERLLQRFLSGRKEGKDSYFDADEVENLLESFEDESDYTYYDEVLALGLRLHPDSVDLQIRQCRAFIDDEEYESALTLIDTIAEFENPDLDMMRLECYAVLDGYDKVIEYTEKLMADKCEYLEAIFEYIAPVLGEVDMNGEAYDYINRGLHLFPDNMILKDELCYNLEVTGNIGKAIEVCNELIDKNPYSNHFWSTIGRLYSINEEYEKAIEAFDFALTCDDSNDELRLLKAYCLYMNENYEKAIESYNEIEKNNQIRMHISPLLAECYLKLGDFETAYRLLNKDFKEKKVEEDEKMYIDFARCCVETDRNEEALKALQEGAGKFPKSLRILSLLVMFYVENGDDRKAVEATALLFDAFEHADMDERMNFVIMSHGGRYNQIKKQIESMLQYYKEIYEKYPHAPHIHLFLAISYLMKGDTKQFKEHYRKTSPDELFEYVKKMIQACEQPIENAEYIPSEDLAKEFLKNKDNHN